MPKIDKIERWETEIRLAEEFREEEFGCFSNNKITKSGENIDYFEKGLSTGYVDAEYDTTSTLNLFHSLVKNVVPALYYQNPRVTTLPRRKKDEISAQIAGEIINHFYETIEADVNNRLVIWDSYVLGIGIYKVGYATKFGADIRDDELEEKRKKSIKDRALEAIGLKKPKTEEELTIRPEVDKRIIAESPYLQWISPFNFLIDPRASCLDDAMWVAHVVEKTVAEVKKNKMFKNTKTIEGTEKEFPTDSNIPIPISHLDEFKTVLLYEIHYRTDDGFYLLYLVKDGTIYKEIYHEKSIYNMDEWQFDVLDFSGHKHKFFKRSEVTKIKNLQDRLTSTIDSILEQVDSFVPKIACDETALSDDGKTALEDGDIGTIVYFNKSPREAISEISMTQFKVDLKALLEEIINIVTIQTGVTKAQLLGMSAGETATEATIAQGGRTLRLTDMSSEINRFLNKQAEKLWKIIRQFVEFEELELITGESGIDPQTGMVLYNWLPSITGETGLELRTGMYRFRTEVGSTQKADSALIIKRIEDLLNILARTDVIALMQQQGKKVDLAEVLRMLLRQMPEVVKDISKIIQDVTQNTQGTLTPEMLMSQLSGGGQGGMTTGSTNNALEAQRGRNPNMRALQSEASQV